MLLQFLKCSDNLSYAAALEWVLPRGQGMKKGSLSVCTIVQSVRHNHYHLVHKGACESEERTQ